MSQYTEADLELAQDVVVKLVQYDRDNTTDYSYSLDLHVSGVQVLAQVFSDLGVGATAKSPGVPSFGPEVQ